MKPILVEPHSPNGFGKVSFATSGTPNLTNTGDIHKKKDSHISQQIDRQMLSPKKSTFILNILPPLRYKELDNCQPIDQKKEQNYLPELSERFQRSANCRALFLPAAQRHGLVKGRVLLVVLLVGTFCFSEPKPPQAVICNLTIKKQLKTVVLSTVLPRLVIVKRSFTCQVQKPVLGFS